MSARAGLAAGSSVTTPSSIRLMRAYRSLLVSIRRCAAGGSFATRSGSLSAGMAEPALRAPSFAAGDLARLDRPLGQQPGHDMHDPRRHLQQFAGETDADERLQRAAVVAASIVEIGACLVGEQHRLRVKAVDQAAT